MVLRQRKNKIQEIVKELDVFVKLDDNYVEQTLTGAISKSKAIIDISRL